MVVWIRVTLDNEHRTMKKQMLHNFTESTKQTPTNTDVWSRADTSSAGAPRKTPFTPTLDVQSLNKAHRTKHREQFLEETGLSNLLCVPTTCFPIRATDNTDNHKRGANTNAVAFQTHKLSDAHTKHTKGEWHHKKQTVGVRTSLAKLGIICESVQVDGMHDLQEGS